MGGCVWSKSLWFAKVKLNIHVRLFISITYPKICLQIPSRIPCTNVVQMWSPMARSFSYALDSFIWDEWESQIIPRFPIPKGMRTWKIHECWWGCSWKANFIDNNQRWLVIMINLYLAMIGPPTRWCCLVGNIDNLAWLMLATNRDKCSHE